MAKFWAQNEQSGITAEVFVDGDGRVYAACGYCPWVTGPHDDSHEAQDAAEIHVDYFPHPEVRS